MRSHHSAEVEQAWAAVVAQLGDAFSLEQVTRYVSAYRGKPLRIEADAHLVAFRGYCAALTDVDLICIPGERDPLLKDISQLHQLAHLLLDHIPAVLEGAATTHDTDVPAERARALGLLCVADYRRPDEHTAETLATMLLEGLAKHKAFIPQQARDLYGW